MYIIHKQPRTDLLSVPSISKLWTLLMSKNKKCILGSILCDYVYEHPPSKNPIFASYYSDPYFVFQRRAFLRKYRKYKFSSYPSLSRACLKWEEKKEDKTNTNAFYLNCIYKFDALYERRRFDVNSDLIAQQRFDIDKSKFSLRLYKCNGKITNP